MSVPSSFAISRRLGEPREGVVGGVLVRHRWTFESCPISAHYRTCLRKTSAADLRQTGDKAPPWVMIPPCSDSLSAALDAENHARSRRRVDPRAPRPAASPYARRNQAVERSFPRWARPAATAGAGEPTRFLRRRRPRSARRDPARRSALRRRAAPASRAASRHRLRDDGAAARRRLRPARRRTSRSGRGADQPRRAHPSPVAPVRVPPNCGSTPRPCESRPIFWIHGRQSFDGLADALRDIVAGAEHPLAAAVGASAAAMKLLSDAPPVDAEIFALWLVGPRLGATTGLGRAGSAARHGDHACVFASRPKRQASASGRSGLGRRRGRRLRDGRPGGLRSRR